MDIDSAADVGPPGFDGRGDLILAGDEQQDITAEIPRHECLQQTATVPTRVENGLVVAPIEAREQMPFAPQIVQCALEKIPNRKLGYPGIQNFVLSCADNLRLIVRIAVE